MTLKTLPNKAAMDHDKLRRRRSVVVHSGARDSYQLARALEEADMLDVLVTDLFWPADRGWARWLEGMLPARLVRVLRQRNEDHLSGSRVRCCGLSGLAVLTLDKLPRVPFSWRRRAARHADATLGRVAAECATQNGSELVSYSYYGFDAFTRFAGLGILFQLHPHPLSMRRILNEELAAHPDCADSLRQEWELSLPEGDFQRLVRETTMPTHILAASSFTRRTLLEQGIPASAVTVIPYGVDPERFRPDAKRKSRGQGPLRLLFVGRINQRKGIKYLLEALRSFDAESVHLTVCGRVVDGLELFRPFGSQVEVRPSVSGEDLVAAYQAADLFVFPSVAEGFGQVLLEALACGLPILSTTHTAAPDLIEDGEQGFIVEPRRPDLLVHHISWALANRAELACMGERARRRAREFTWERFRSGVVTAMDSIHHSQRREQATYV
jgi:glycosyltransferase involved in cell wall biosynthesis